MVALVEEAEHVPAPLRGIVPLNPCARAQEARGLIIIVHLAAVRARHVRVPIREDALPQALAREWVIFGAPLIIIVILRN